MGVRECVSYNRDLIKDCRVDIKKYKPDDSLAIGEATIELFDSTTGEKIYEAKTQNVINNIVNKMAYMDYFYYKIKESSSYYYYEAPFNMIALFDDSAPEDANTIAIKGKLIGYADKRTPYSGSDVLKGSINSEETQLDILGDGKLHFVFDFPTHAANGTFQKIAWLKNKNTFQPNLSNMDQGDNKVLDSQMGIAYRGDKVYQLQNNTLRISDKNNFTNSTDYTLGTDTKQNGIYVTETNIWTVANSKKVYKYDLNRNLINTYTLVHDISCGSGYSAELHHIFIDESGMILGTYLSSGSGCTILKLSLDLQTVIASRYYPYGETNPELSYRRGGFGKFDKDTLVVMSDGHKYSLIDINTLEFKARGVPEKTSHGWAFAQNENGKNIATCYKKNVTNSSQAFCDVEFLPLIGAETLLAAPVTKTPTNTMKIQYDFEVTKVL